MFDTCIILAGGRGERLRPHTDITPKPLIRVSNVSIIEEQIEYLNKKGIQNFLILTGYKAEEFDKLVACYEKSVHIRVRAYKTPAEYLTLRRLQSACNFFDGDLLIIYGDNYAEVNVTELYKQFKYGQFRLDSISVLAHKRNLSESKQREFIEDISSFNPYSLTRNATVDIGFMCISASLLKNLIGKTKDVNQRFEDWYFSNRLLKRGYHPYFWSYLSLTDEASLLEARTFFSGKKTLFTDRDGVITYSKAGAKHIKEAKDIEFNISLLAALSACKEGIGRLVVVTNQAWASRESEAYLQVEWYVEQIVRSWSGVDSVETYSCRHDVEERCNCRKPKPGLFLQYLNSISKPVLPSRALMIGDSSSDSGAAEHLMLDYMDVSDASQASLLAWLQS